MAKPFPTNKDLSRLRSKINGSLLFFDGSLDSLGEIEIEGVQYEIHLTIKEKKI